MKQLCAAVVIVGWLGQVGLADSESLEQAKQELQEIKDGGTDPSFVQFVELVNRDDIQLVESEFIKVFIFLRSLQDPEISCEDLAESQTLRTGRQWREAISARMDCDRRRAGVPPPGDLVGRTGRPSVPGRRQTAAGGHLRLP